MQSYRATPFLYKQPNTTSKSSAPLIMYDVYNFIFLVFCLNVDSSFVQANSDKWKTEPRIPAPPQNDRKEEEPADGEEPEN